MLKKVNIGYDVLFCKIVVHIYTNIQKKHVLIHL